MVDGIHRYFSRSSITIKERHVIRCSQNISQNGKSPFSAAGNGSPARTVSGKILLFSHNLFSPTGYVFMSDRPFYFEPIKRAPRRIEDTRCFWDLTDNLALRTRRYISGRWDTRTFAFCDEYPSRRILDSYLLRHEFYTYARVNVTCKIRLWFSRMTE